MTPRFCAARGHRGKQRLDSALANNTQIFGTFYLLLVLLRTGCRRLIKLTSRMSFSKDQAITTFGTTVEMWRTAPPFSYCEEECAFILAAGNPLVNLQNIFSLNISCKDHIKHLNLQTFRIPLLVKRCFFASVIGLFRVVRDTNPVSKAGLFVSHATPTAIANKYFRVVDDTKTGATKLFSCRTRHQNSGRSLVFVSYTTPKNPRGA